jgi:transcriptional regulator with XRE-family HTH domain
LAQQSVDVLPDQPKDVGANLRQLRESAGLSREALATRSGVSARGIEDIEKGASPRISTLSKLAEALGVAPDLFMTGPTPVEDFGVVRQGRTEQVPRRDQTELSGEDAPPTPAGQLLEFLSQRLGYRRVAGELTDKDLIAAAYTLARKHGFSAEDYRLLDAWRDQIIQGEKG